MVLEIDNRIRKLKKLLEEKIAERRPPPECTCSKCPKHGYVVSMLDSEDLESVLTFAEYLPEMMRRKMGMKSSPNNSATVTEALNSAFYPPQNILHGLELERKVWEQYWKTCCEENKAQCTDRNDVHAKLVLLNQRTLQLRDSHFNGDSVRGGGE